jgi:hypothetical protein
VPAQHVQTALSVSVQPFLKAIHIQDAQNGLQARPQARKTRRRTLWGTLRI